MMTSNMDRELRNFAKELRQELGKIYKEGMITAAVLFLLNLIVLLFANLSGILLMFNILLAVLLYSSMWLNIKSYRAI